MFYIHTFYIHIQKKRHHFVDKIVLSQEKIKKKKWMILFLCYFIFMLFFLFFILIFLIFFFTILSLPPHTHTPTSDFHPRIIGLCGTTQEIHQVAKAYRVYFSAGLSENPSDDYLVDHTIIQYLMNPEGKLASYFGQNTTAEQAAAKIIDAIRLYNEEQALKEKAKKEEAFEKQKQAYEQAQLSAASASQKQQ